MKVIATLDDLLCLSYKASIMATTEKSAADKKAALQKQMEALQAQMEALNQEAVHDVKLKLSDARKAVQELEAELEELTGRRNDAPKKARRERRASVADEVLQPLLLKALATHGKEGLNAKQLAEFVGQDPIRVRKFIGDNPKALKRTGAGPGTKFFLP